MSTMSLTALPASKVAARRVLRALPDSETDTHHLSLPPVISATAVAEMLGVVVKSFYTRREHLEKIGFPPKLPGVNGWSTSAILRWIETNGETYQPAIAAQASEPSPHVNRLERRYG